MTDNFKQIREYMIEQNIPETEEKSGDLFFLVLLIRRGKDFPDLPAANYTFKSYYIDSLEKFDKVKDEIVKCCDIFGLRAYVSVVAKSKRDFTKYCSLKFAENTFKNDYKKPWKIPDHVFGKLGSKNEDRWIIDVDDCEEYKNYLETIHSCIMACESKFDNPIITHINTKSGIHIITHPFNLQRFSMLCGQHGFSAPDVKKNHITLLYENL